MGGLCGCCAEDPPDNGKVQDHKEAKQASELVVGTEESVRNTFVNDGVCEFDLTSTGQMVLPTYPLKDVFAQELKRQIKDGRFSVKRRPEAQENLRNILSEDIKRQIKMGLAGRNTYPRPEASDEDDSIEEEDEEQEDKKSENQEEAAGAADSEKKDDDGDEDDGDDEKDGDDDDGGDGGTVASSLPLIVPIIDPEVLMRPQVWGIFGDWKDLQDEEGLLLMNKYGRECWEFCYDVDREKFWDDDCMERPSYVVGEYGDSSSWMGVYRIEPFREDGFFEFWRGNFATGIRGIIDPFDPDNPYGPKNASDMSDIKHLKKKSISDVKTMSRISQNQTQATLDMSKISMVSANDMTIHELDLEDIDENDGCLYQKASVGPMGSIFMSKSNNEVHQEIPVCPENTFFDDAIAALQGFTKGTDIAKITSLKCHVNTWGLSSNNWFADEMVSKMKSLTKFDLADTVQYRHRSDLCMGIKSILMAAVDKNIQYIDLSDNFLDMDGGRAFSAFLAENNTLQVLKVNRCSLGLKATEQIIEALSKNSKLNLTEFQAAGNDFCVDSMKQLIEVFEEMETLEIVNMSQCINPFKPHSGLKYLIQALITNRATLRYVDVSGNTWNNDMEIVEQIQLMLQKCLVMRSLNISCLGVNKTGCQMIIKTFSDCANEVWGLDCNLKQLIWNKDLRCSPKTALQFAEKELPNIYNLKLKHIQLQGVFRTLENRNKIKHALKNIDITCILDGQCTPDETEEVSNTEYPESKV